MDKEKKSEIHITNNFNAPIGQHIDHVDTINFRMDGDGNFHFGMVDELKKEGRDKEDEKESRKEENIHLADGENQEVRQKIASIYDHGLLNEEDPSRLYFLLLAMWARRILKSKEIPAFVRLVIKARPSIANSDRTEEKIIYAVQNMNKKANRYFDTFIQDQSSMIGYIDLMYPKNKDGSRRKDCEDVIKLTQKLFLALK